MAKLFLFFGEKFAGFGLSNQKYLPKMRITILTLSLILLGFSINTQAQSPTTSKKLEVSQDVKSKYASASSSQPKTSSQQTKDNIRRRNMAKYKAMSQKSKKSVAASKKKNHQHQK